MVRIRFFVLVIVLTIVAFLIGCSSGGGSNPLTPEKTTGSMDNVPIIGVTDAQSSFNAIGLFGAYELTINSDLTTELVSKRVGAIGEDYIVSGLGFFTIKPCPTCLKMTGVEITPDGNVLLTFEISHPFKKGNTSEPPTAANRLDLDVFDLAMVIAPTGGTPVTYALTGESVYTDNCVDPDGFTTELAEVIDDDAALPYFLVIDDSDTGTSTLNKFEMGTVGLSFDVGFNLSGPAMTFDMYLTMGYGFSARRPDRLHPKYYNPEFNRKAAWKVAVTPPEGVDPPAMGNTWDDNDSVATYNVVVDVYDWQIGATVATAADFADADPSEIYAASEPSGVSVEIPGMNTALNTLAVPDVPTATGLPDDPWVYTLAIANENLLAPGEYTGLVKVTDERAVMAPADGRDFMIDSPDGVELVHYSMPEYATYQIFTATVVLGCGPITGTIDTPTCPVSGVVSGQSINFTCTVGSANGGDPIVSIEWDMDYDGTTFDVDGTGAAVLLGPFDNPNCGTPPEDPVTYTVAVRATDSCSVPNVTVFDTCEVTVDTCMIIHVYPEDFEPIIDEDEWFDIGVQDDSFVYVVADHPATGNTGGYENTGTRTALQYANDLSSMQVINSGGTGMAQPQTGSGWGSREFNRIDVSTGGTLVTNFAGARVAPWSVAGTTATTGICCYHFQCGTGAGSVDDVTDTVDVPGRGDGVTCIARIHPSCVPANWMIGFDDSNIFALGGYNLSASFLFPDDYGIKGMHHMPSTNNEAVLYTTSSAGFISIVGTCFTYDGNALTIATHGTYGTDDEQFSGGRDLAVDSAGNILTLEDHGSGEYRFQKFDDSLTWIWSSGWSGNGAPIRMDYDKADDMLYVLSDAGITICTVDP